MAEYSSLKVPELKKLLAEKSLPQTGNKADLIARLQENDSKAAGGDQPAAAESKEDEINYSDDEATTAKPAEPAVPAAEPAAAETSADKPADGDAKAAEEAPAAPAPSYALGLASTAADEEAKRRADRAKRFGIEEDDDAKKRAERAQRFGLDEKELASGLDSALPERPLKRGRGRAGEGEDARSGKRQSLDRRGGGRRGGRPGRDGERGGDSGAGGAKKGSVLDDPTEKAKAEKRAARFAAA